MPPVQHVAFDELLTCVADDLCSCDVGADANERGRILQLVAKTKGPARLIIRRSTPHPAAQVLVRQPAIHDQIDLAVGCFNFNGRYGVAPEFFYSRERLLCAVSVPILFNQIGRCGVRRRFAEQDGQLASGARRQHYGDSPGCTGIEAAARSAAQIAGGCKCRR